MQQLLSTGQKTREHLEPHEICKNNPPFELFLYCLKYFTPHFYNLYRLHFFTCTLIVVLGFQPCVTLACKFNYGTLALRT